MSIIHPAAGYINATRRIAENIRVGLRRPAEEIEVEPPPPPPPPPGDTRMPVGVMGLPLSDMPSGPGRINNAAWNFDLTMYTPNPSSLASELSKAQTNGIFCLLNLAGGRRNYIDNFGTASAAYSEPKFFARVDRFLNIQALVDALCDNPPRAAIYLSDELNHDEFNGSTTAVHANRMGLYVKYRFNKLVGGVRRYPLCIMRMHGDFLGGMGGDWPNSGPRPPSGGWTGLDYGWAQYSGKDQGDTFTQYFNDQISKLKAVNLGTYISLNWIDGGIARQPNGSGSTFDGVADCWDYLNNGSSSGIVHGTAADGFADAQTWTCASFPGLRPGGPVFTVAVNPAWLRRWGDLMWNNQDVAGAMLWTNPINAWDEYNVYYTRSNWYSALRDVVTKMRGRTTYTGARTAKPLPAGWTP